uniref:LITAF domain-containing protein n=1 Tax=Dracunculus medinensis TaxID=318479 RepID=A0A0N4URR8_DRAME
LAIIGCLFFIPLAVVPFVVHSCKDVLHYCPNCNTLLSIRIRF